MRLIRSEQGIKSQFSKFRSIKITVRFVLKHKDYIISDAETGKKLSSNNRQVCRQTIIHLKFIMYLLKGLHSPS